MSRANLDAMGQGDNGIYHGDRDCFLERSFFVCSNCKRKVCFCGGHDGETETCRDHCDDCACEDCP